MRFFIRIFILRTCIGINKEPPKNQNWYCHKCGAKSDSLDNRPQKSTSARVTNLVRTITPTSFMDTDQSNANHGSENTSTLNDNINNAKNNSNSDNNTSSSNNNISSSQEQEILDPSLLYSISDSNNYLNSIKKKKKSLG